MTRPEFELRIAQVDTVIRSCSYSFKNKTQEKSYKNLLALFKAIKDRYTGYDVTKLNFCSQILDIVYTEIEYLDYKSDKDIPKHLIGCLEIALSDWIDNPDLFSFVFLSNNQSLHQFFTLTLDEDSIDKINRNCTYLNLGVEYNHSLIPITQSRFFNNSFLSNIPAYHELGHFIDSYYMISKKAVQSSTFTYSDSIDITIKLSYKGQ